MRMTMTIMAACLIAGCVVPPRPLTDAEKAYVEEATVHPVEFTLPSADREIAWGRAQSYIGRFSHMAIREVTEYVIQTYSPPRYTLLLGYNVTRTPGNGEDRYHVSCLVGSVAPSRLAFGVEKASILAYYITTGEEPSSRVATGY